MKTPRRETPEHLQKFTDTEMDLEDDFMEVGWDDALKKNIQLFWETIDDEDTE
jgi:hypothetical protein